MADTQDNPQAVPPGADGAAGGPQFSIQRIYLKDSSLESPHSPQIFQSQWQPKINFDLKTKSDKIQDDVYEVVLTLTVEAQLDDKPAFLVEVHQAGIFAARSFPDGQLEQLLATVCPNILFPYAREAIDSLVIKASFPALNLAPINFDALYAQQKQAQAQQAEAPAAAGGDTTPPAPETAQ